MCRASWPRSQAILAEAGVSIESMIQRVRAPGAPVAIVMITTKLLRRAWNAP